jgi:hypothetical protein
VPPKRRKLRALPEVAGDINALPTQKLKEIALQRISDVMNGRLSGARLEDMSRTGDLTDCFKLYFDETGGPDPAYRVVYRELAEGAFEVVEVVAVEQREELYVYALAALRLGRLPEGSGVPERPQPRRSRPTT